MKETGMLITLLTLIAIPFNFRYLVDIPSAIKTFAFIYDPFVNLIISDPENNPTILTCTDNICSYSSYKYHSSWLVEFWNRFTSEGSQNRQFLLKLHVLCNTVTLFLMMIQISSFFRSLSIAIHRWTGRLAILLTFVGTSASMFLALDMDKADSYGGAYAKYGFLQMGLTVLLLTSIGAYYVQVGDIENHKKWMNRAYGSIYGSFFIFRLIEFITAPLSAYLNSNLLFLKYPALINIWFSAILGVLLAEKYLNAGVKVNSEEIKKEK